MANPLMSVFKKPKKESQPDIIAKDRAECKAVAAVLKKVRYKDYTEMIPQEQMEKYRQLGTDLAVLIENSQIVRLQTEEINKEIKAIAEYLQDAVSNGCTRTIDHIFRALDFGVRKARKDLPEKDVAQAEREMTRRLEQLKGLRTVVEISSKADQLDEVLRIQLTRQRKESDEFKTLCQALQRELKAKPHLVKEMEELGMGNDTLSGEARALDIQRVGVIQKGENVEQLRALIATNRAELQQQLSAMNALLIQLTQKELLLDEETIQVLQDQQERIKSTLVRQEQQVRELEALNHNFTLALRELSSSPDMVADVIRHEDAYSKLVAQMEAEEEGRRLGVENLRQAEQRQTISH